MSHYYNRPPGSDFALKHPHAGYTSIYYTYSYFLTEWIGQLTGRHLHVYVTQWVT